MHVKTLKIESVNGFPNAVLVEPIAQIFELPTDGILTIKVEAENEILDEIHISMDKNSNLHIFIDIDELAIFINKNKVF